MTALAYHNEFDAFAAIATLEILGRQGFTVSVCCGPSAGAFAWSVNVLSPTGEEFDQPFAARSFAHAVDIAVIEIGARWTRNESIRQ